MMSKNIAIIGSGFAGLSAACYLAKEGCKVTLYEKNETVGGRARKFKANGFVFDMGPSWYWMPDVFEDFFNRFGQSVSDYYQLVRLDPSYKVYFEDGQGIDIPASEDELHALFESIEPGSSKNLRKFLKEAKYKYEVGINDLVHKPGHSITEFLDMRLAAGILKLHVFQSISKYVRSYFRHPKLIRLLEFPVLFLGAKPEDTPALYSLMNYADMSLGTWYPEGGMHKIIEAMESLAIDLGATIKTNANVDQIKVENGLASGVYVNERFEQHDFIIAGADYHHVEQQLLEPKYRVYDRKYWESRKLAPSSLIFYIGINKKLKNLRHHNLFFDKPFDHHAAAIYDTPKWPDEPLFYVSCTSKTDASVAPQGMENLFVLIPVAPGLKDDNDIREKYFGKVMRRMEHLTGQSIEEHIVFKKSYAHNDFIADYNSFKGNAYGLANTLSQTALLKPSMRNKKVKNLYYAGQLTVPGPGVPPSLISGKVAANELLKSIHRSAKF